MAKHISRFIIISGIIVAVLLGCSSPDPNPIVEPPNTREGTPLDSTADLITLDGSPYIWDYTTTNDLGQEELVNWVIGAGRTVTIEPGVEIMFAGRYHLTVEGKLVAKGQPGAPIRFTTAFNHRDFGQWRGLRFTNPDEASELEYCIFTYGAFFDTDTLTARGQDAQNYRGMLAIWNSSPIIERCVIFYNQNNGVYIKGEQSAPTIRYCIITENDASGIRADTILVENLRGPNDNRIAYNCVADNSAPPFIIGQDSLLFGRYARINNNVDSCDIFYNIDQPPLMVDPENDDFGLQSCSPCIDAGPFVPPLEETDPDGTIIDMGVQHYEQATAELRGRAEGVLDATTYRMTCDVAIAPGATLTIPAGARLEVTGIYAIEVYGELRIEGTEGNRVFIGPEAGNGNNLWGGLLFFERETNQPSLLQYADIIGYDLIDVEKPGTTFEGVRFEDGFQYGVNVTTGNLSDAGKVTLRRCEIVNAGTFGVQADSSALELQGVIIDGTKGRGVTLDYTYDFVTIRNSIVCACSTTALYVGNFSDPTLTNNTFACCVYYGIHMINNCFPTAINNIVVDNGRTGVISQNSSCPFLDYNDVYNNSVRDETGADYDPAAGCNLFLETSISSDPLFVGAGDYHLQAGSPCIDAGHPDIQDGDGSVSDMGAYGGPGGDHVGVSALPAGRPVAGAVR